MDGLRNGAQSASTRATDEITRINHICSVDALLSDGRRLNEMDLKSYIGDFDSIDVISELSPFALISILFLSRRRKRFGRARLAAKEEIARRIFASGTRLPTETEATLLLVDFISCPHLDDDEKIPALKHAYRATIGKPCSTSDARLILRESSWISFADWKGQADIRRMLARRELTPPYESA